MQELRNIGDSVKRRRLGKSWERFSAPETWLNILFWGYIFAFFFSLSPSLSSMVLRIFSVDPRRAVRLCGLFRKMLFLGAAVFALFAVFGLGLGKASTVTFILRFADVRKRATLGFGKRSVRGARALWNRYSAWQSALIDKTEAHSMLACLLNLCKVDLFAFCWVAVFAAQFFLCRHRDGGVLAWMLMPVPIFVLGVQMGEGTLRRPEKGRQLLLSVFAIGTSVCALLLAARFETVSFMILDGDRTAGMLRFLLLLAVGLIVQSLALAFAATAENLECRAYAFVKMVVVTLMLYLLVEILLWVMIIPLWPRVAHYLRRIFLSPMLSFNAFFALLSVLTLWSIFGARITGTLCCIVGMLLVIGNLIKTVYHATLLTPGDLLSIKELFLIMPGYIGGAGIAALLCIAGGGILFLIWKIKKVLCFLCPRPKLFAAALLLPVCLTFFADVSSKKYTDIAKYPVRWFSEMENWARGGAMVYNAENIQRFKSFFSSVPDNYSKETIKSFKAPDKNRNSRHLSFDKLKERPTVVLIMAESLFDVMRLDDVEFNLDATATVRAYQQGTMISPSFGGGTARVEFEGLTGYSNIFLPSGAMAYTTYFNNPDRRVPSIASAFSAAGYTTTAVHLNDPLFFNRRNVYEILGFDKFISKDDYTFTRNQLVNGLVRDSEFFRIIEEQLEKSDAPQFIFGISIEGHAPYNKHYKETEIKVVKSAKELSRDAVYTLEQYAQYVKNFDDDLAEFISYLKKSEKPVILYVWGDHLPKLPVFDEIDYFKKDKNNRWATPLLVYSNCAQIAIDAKYMTPNQVAPQVLSDSGIPYNSFYDYVYSLRKTLPVLHRSYLKKDDWNSEKLKEYQLLQYDLMFGNQYLFADN